MSVGLIPNDLWVWFLPEAARAALPTKLFWEKKCGFGSQPGREQSSPGMQYIPMGKAGLCSSCPKLKLVADVHSAGCSSAASACRCSTGEQLCLGLPGAQHKAGAMPRAGERPGATDKATGSPTWSSLRTPRQHELLLLPGSFALPELR